MIEFKYRPDVDGLRAVAIALVLLYHGKLGFSGGYVGVDVFFVISGYLITGLILKEQQAGDFRLANFWVRRIRRIIPAATVVVATTLAVGWVLMLPQDYTALAESAIAQQLMLSNVYFWRNLGYFHGGAELKPLLHTWSLAVEEQFYLVFPFLLVILAHVSRRARIATLLGTTALSLVLSEWGVRNIPGSTFFLLPTRAWELLLGSLICFAPRPSALKSWQAETISWVAVGTMLGAAWRYNSGTHFPGLAAVGPCLAAGLLIYVNSARLSTVGRLLAAKPVVVVGLMSYSLYLWHWPVLAFTRYFACKELPLGTSLAALGCSFILAYLSWRFVETPWRRPRPGQRRRIVYAAAVCSGIAISCVAAIVVTSAGAPARFNETVLHIADTRDMPRIYLTTQSAAQEGRLPTIGFTGDGRQPQFLLWGDSHLESISILCDALANEFGVTGALAMHPGTPPLLDAWTIKNKDEVIGFNRSIRSYVRRHDIAEVVLVSRWSVYIDESPENRGNLIVDAEYDLRSGSAVETLRRSLRRTLASFQEDGVRVWIMKQVPTQDFDVTRRLQLCEYFGLPLPTGSSREWSTAHHRCANRVLEECASLGMRSIDPDPFCYDEDGRAIIFDGQRSLYVDSNHVSVHGADQLLRPLLGPVFQEIAEFASDGDAASIRKFDGRPLDSRRRSSEVSVTVSQRTQHHRTTTGEY
jgi:peptidoglycan/LPS O-acetylase OafA/YrhL